jgi:3-(3-hydroxy-phenyl)propionate hydroxylase
MSVLNRDVVVVGAGPVGLTAALALAARGRRPTVVEAGSVDRVRPGSRAIFIHRVSLEILNRVRPALGDALMQHGLSWTTKRTFYRGRQVYSRSYPAPPPGSLPTATSLPQVVTERVLLEACMAAGVELIWDTPIEAVEGTADAVHLKSERGPVLSAKYVVGADGARSAVRESAGLRLEGPRTSNAFVIVDTREDALNPLPAERTFHYEHPGVGYRNVLFVPFAGHWRVDLQCFDTDNPDDFSGADGVRNWLPQVMPMAYADRVTWVSTYVFRQAIADAFVDRTRRILLTGEAAHLFAPFGARGLNSGIADAFVAAEAVDCALAAGPGADADRAVARFGAARRAAAERNRAASSMALRHLEARSAVTRVMRRVAGSLGPAVSAVGRWMDKAPYGPPLSGADRDGMHY